ncbi:MAG: hypothetical protein IPH85_10835 [Ignavibacteria bacterium]|nr:hypothetical protein [Ignavibacteria bacterium]
MGSVTAQTEVVIDLQAMKVNAITRSDKPTFTIEGIVIRYPEFVRLDRQIARTNTAGFGTSLNDSIFVRDGRVITGPRLHLDSITTRENGDVTECVIHAQLTNCKLPLKWGSVSIVFPFHLVACYRVLGSEGVCNESKVNITVTY